MGSSRRGLGPAFEAADVADDGYHDGKDALAAIAELRRLSALGRPFFLGLGFHKPHLPFNAPKRYWDMYQGIDVPLAENPFAPEGTNEFSLTNFGELRGYFGIPKEGRIPDDLARELIHGYAACVTYMDAQFGKVMAELERLGLRENTVIILWGDHGWKLGEHDSWCKHTNFEIDARAPMVASTPDTAGTAKRTRSLVEFVDMYPSLCELCGLPVPEHCEGTSFAPLIPDPDQPWKDAAFSQYPRQKGTVKVMGYTMRTDRYRYTEWQDRGTGDVLARELYDHNQDPKRTSTARRIPTVLRRFSGCRSSSSRDGTARGIASQVRPRTGRSKADARQGEAGVGSPGHRGALRRVPLCHRRAPGPGHLPVVGGIPRGGGAVRLCRTHYA